MDDEESARLEEVRREIREMKGNSPRQDNEEEDEGPIDPRQGKKKMPFLKRKENDVDNIIVQL